MLTASPRVRRLSDHVYANSLSYQSPAVVGDDHVHSQAPSFHGRGAR